MSLITIGWSTEVYTTDGIEYLVGVDKSILSLANLFERDRIRFKVYEIMGPVSQSHFGYHGFRYWLEPAETFDKQVK